MNGKVCRKVSGFGSSGRVSEWIQSIESNMVLMSLRAREWFTGSETRNCILVDYVSPSSHCYGFES